VRSRKTKFEKRNSKIGTAKTAASLVCRVSSFKFRIPPLVLSALLQISCAAPGEPQPRHPVIPARVTDLAAAQRGDGALLTFTPPAKSEDGKRLSAQPMVEILRGFGPVGAKAPPAGALAPVTTIPGAVLDTYVAAGRVEFRDAIPPEEIARHAGAAVFYAVRCRISKRTASEDSNLASFAVYPVPAPIGEVKAEVIEAGVQLNWTAPATVSGGAPFTSPGGFRIYRAEVREPAAASGERPVFLAATPSPEYLDSQIEWGKTYSYTVRTVARYGEEPAESEDSPPVQVTPKDIFPPAPPLDLVVVFVPAAGSSPAAVELSWSISPEPDAAGYYVYRGGEGEAKTQRVTPSLLPTPAFRDTSVMLGAIYTYTVTAVDRSGNESRPSNSVSVAIPKTGG
jgi:hypothetical protein